VKEKTTGNTRECLSKLVREIAKSIKKQQKKKQKKKEKRKKKNNNKQQNNKQLWEKGLSKVFKVLKSTRRIFSNIWVPGRKLPIRTLGVRGGVRLCVHEILVVRKGNEPPQEERIGCSF